MKTIQEEYKAGAYEFVLEPLTNYIVFYELGVLYRKLVIRKKVQTGKKFDENIIE